MSERRRRVIVATLGIAAVALYIADLAGLKPPPRILPSVVLGGAAVVLGVRPKPPGPGAAPRTGWSSARVMSIVGLMLHALLLVPILPIGLIAPGEGVIAIHGVWVAGLIVALRHRRSNPGVVLLTPFVTAALLAAIIWLGVTVLRWEP